jgi:hypothetical protein
MQANQPAQVRFIWLLVLICLLLVEFGCGGSGPKGYTVKGIVLKNGNKLELPERETLVILLDTAEEARRVQNFATYNPADGTFICKGLENRGVPAGKMRIEIWPGRANGPQGKDDLFKNQFKGDRSPLEIELTEANSQKLVVDVGKKSVSTQ